MHASDASGRGQRHQWLKQTARLLDNTFVRRSLAPGVAAWVYRYSNEVPLPIPTIATGAIEVAVQLAGTWQVSRWPHESLSVDAGDVFVLPKGVRHTYAFQATAPVHGLQVGFAIDPQLFNSDRWCTCSTTRVPAARAQHFHELAHAVLEENDGVDVAAAVVEATKALFDEVDSPLSRVQLQLESTLDRPLYLAQLAEDVGLHPKTLSRRFVDALGVTPVRYRTEQRLQRAIRLLWQHPELSVATIAAMVGFDDLRFFLRLTRTTFGLTPSQLGRRHAPV